MVPLNPLVDHWLQGADASESKAPSSSYPAGWGQWQKAPFSSQFRSEIAMSESSGVIPESHR